ncbi:exonuclease SbcCD subunit D [Candidatus Woesearchaeota archaeon]|nr:exonuclease SbcCD subunit D [Candidatus Woesearchaeota archaeon]
MKFAHLADCHIGSWRDPKLRESSTKAFVKAVEKIKEENVDFVLLSGDLFNTSHPPVDSLRIVVAKLKELKDSSIPVYIVAGSHDFSPSGKTMLDVLESAGFVVNVARGKVEENRLYLNFTVDKKTNAKITGMIGKKGGLEKSYYESLVRAPLEKEAGYKIFMFHTALTELKPKELEKMDSAPVSFLPKGFDYYAGGHVHIVDKKSLEGYKAIVFPGPLFPNSFSEIEKLQNGGFYIVEDDAIRYEPIVVNPVFSINIDCSSKNPEEVELEIMKGVKNKEFLNTIVTIRLFGQLKTGRPSDINFKEVFRKFYGKGAFFVMKNSNKLTSREFEEVKVDTGSVDDIEEKLIAENSGQSGMFDPEKERRMIKELMHALSAEKNEGENSADFEKRLRESMNKILE